MGHGAQLLGPCQFFLTIFDCIENLMNINRILQITAYSCFLYIVIFMYVSFFVFSR